jgi:8-oxo-dGTP pyrophosphatase MutT (NUDIX family)
VSGAASGGAASGGAALGGAASGGAAEPHPERLAAQHADAVATLSAWRAPSPAQDALRRDYLAHLRRHPDGTSRGGPAAHLTTSCFVLDPRADRVLLTLHRKGRFWVQFGGHLEPEDQGLADAALREGREESGLPGLRLLAPSSAPSSALSAAGRPQPVDLHRHALSAAFGRCREHLDVAFVAVADPDERPTVSEESVDVAWWPVDRLPPGVVPDLPERLGPVVAAVRAATG